MDATHLTPIDVDSLPGWFLAGTGKSAVYSAAEKVANTNTLVRTNDLLKQDLREHLGKPGVLGYFVRDRDITHALAAFRKLEADSKTFGFGCASLDYLVTRTDRYQTEPFSLLADQIDSWIDREDIKFIAAKVDPENQDQVNLSLQRGFDLIETMLTLRSYLADPLADPDLEVRAYQSEDLEKIGKIAAESFVKSRFMQDGRFDPEQVGQRYRQWAQNCCNDGSDQVLVTEIDGEVAGFITCDAEPIRYTELSYGHIELLAVDRAHQGHGVGKSLLRAANRWFKDQGCSFVDVETEGTNRQSIGLYKASSYVPTFMQHRMHRWIK